MGVWDTVGALGIPFSLMGLLDPRDEFYDTKMGSNVGFARHALAIDEQRADFEPTIWLPRTGVDLKQVWFSGAHSDVGGALAADRSTGTRVSDLALGWMLDEAKAAGLKHEPHVRDRLTDGTTAALHKSRRHIFRIKRPLHRPLRHAGIPTKVHPSVKLRWEADPRYRPRKLRELVQHGWDQVDVGT